MDKKIIALVVIILIVVLIGVWVLTRNKNSSVSQNLQSKQIKVQIEILKEGTGEGAKTGDLVTVNYTGTLENGTKFDSSVDPAFGHAEPFPFTLGQNRVIRGWEQGVLGMKVVETRKLTIPPELGYGAQAVGTIPANSTLIFEVELLKIN